MKVRSTFRILALLIALLIFRSHSVFGRGPRPKKPEVKRKPISAEVQAKRDAEDDLNKRFWIGTGCAFILLPALGCFAGASVARVNPGSDFDAECGLAIGSILAAGPLVLMLGHQPTPPPERFIGKSPEYIVVYTNVYKKRTRQLSRPYTAQGMVIGCVITGGLGILMGQIFENLE
ncbi:hypothetical protein C6499_04535 [Candidatus Poribacteria bacterium]|nr:MAG: hypothetical protein C6499_04535 [Candidatus Poribacteria bacterium]